MSRKKKVHLYILIKSPPIKLKNQIGNENVHDV